MVPLVAAYLSGEERLAPLYAHFPPATVPRPGVPSVDRPIDEATAAAIGRWNEANGAAGRSLKNAGRAGGGRTRFVLAGQQPGLRLGPELTLWKMLTLTAPAALPAERLGSPVVPAFRVGAPGPGRPERRQ